MELRRLTRENRGLAPLVTKRLYKAGFERIICYAASENNSLTHKILSSAQRPFALAICRGYNTLSTDAALVLSGLVPINNILTLESKRAELIPQALIWIQIPLQNRLTHPSTMRSTSLPMINPFQTHHLLPSTLTAQSLMMVVGAGWCLYSRNIPLLKKSYILREENSVFQAECLAIYKALEWFLEQPHQSITLASDSLSSLESLASPYTKSWSVMRNKILVNNIINSGKTVSFHWVKAHVGLEGNEMADSLARLAFKYPAPYVPIPTPKSWFKYSAAKKRSQIGKHLGMPPSRADRIYSSSALNSILTGHGPFSNYFQRFKIKTPSPAGADTRTLTLTISFWRVLFWTRADQGDARAFDAYIVPGFEPNFYSVAKGRGRKGLLAYIVPGFVSDKPNFSICPSVAKWGGERSMPALTIHPRGEWRGNLKLLGLRSVCAPLGASLPCAKIAPVLGIPRQIESGVPQGSILSPILFNLYINDIPHIPQCRQALFADHTALLSSSRSPDILISRLQNYLDIICNWCDKWKLNLNPKKSQAIIFPPRDSFKFTPRTNLIIYSSPINWTQQVKYLGVTFDSKLKFTSHVKDIIRKSKIAKASLSNMFSSKSGLSVNQKFTLYRSCILPIVTYALPVWFKYITLTDRKRIDAFMRICLRSTVNAPFNLSNAILKQDLNQP
ncbi:hypothetical protein LAZ67_6003243 [Cordylochernes scorpioides]|uniref:RNase H type-1 domain-containing protein n=1 Tax=Cordylochernes scorpioides TaxID=51811 RepID=A0ABY6KLT1_9ARAC|nr:hypothetical protein LAZ67_6003243 [Cordylochernes scorpioides]